MISKRIKQQNLAKITRQAQAEACKRDYYTFIREFWSEIVNDPFKPNWHIPYLCDELTKMLTRVADRKPKLHDLVVNVPPGTTKSLICTVMLPAWVWAGEWWWMRLIKASYSATLSTEQADLTRDIVQSDKYKHYFPQVRIKKGSDAKSHYKVVHWDKKRKMWQLGGGLMSTSVGAAVTGFHAHVRLTDDPLDPNSSHSIVKLNAANKWLDQNYSSRVVDKAETPHIMIMQRVDKGDPSGVLIDRKEQGKRVQHICLPGEVHTAENRERVSPASMLACYDAQGGYLDPVRLNKEMILDMTIDLGRDGKAAQVDQNPQSRSGGMFKDADFKIIKGFDRSQITRSIRYWDKAGTEGGGCFTAGVLMHRLQDGTFVVEDLKKGQWAAPEREKQIKQTAILDGKEDVIVWVEQEPGSGGKESAENTIRNLAGWHVFADKVSGAKEVRAEPYAIQAENGNIKVLNRKWTKDFLDRHEDFPNTDQKDEIDAASGALNKLAEYEAPNIRVIG